MTSFKSLGRAGKQAIALSLRRNARRQGSCCSQVFEAGPIAVALNRLDTSLFVHAFGRRLRQNPRLVLEAVVRIWTPTLYQSIHMTDEIES